MPDFIRFVSKVHMVVTTIWLWMGYEETKGTNTDSRISTWVITKIEILFTKLKPIDQSGVLEISESFGLQVACRFRNSHTYLH